MQRRVITGYKRVVSIIIHMSKINVTIELNLSGIIRPTEGDVFKGEKAVETICNCQCLELDI
jgi:hypothetical protein